MSRRGVNASLEEQMAKLHDNMSARDKRRTQQQDMRQVCPPGVDARLHQQLCSTCRTREVMQVSLAEYAVLSP